ncbi:fibroblast growth factor 19 [Athene cunicularia]|uniref:fibroblast growth factor 19 n=1 Tax=Athene cunicularia TaxID=194338 RepID=UPI000EF689DB|nr:fibroblast growth factor 19 [Athene cunicularia]
MPGGQVKIDTWLKEERSQRGAWGSTCVWRGKLGVCGHPQQCWGNPHPNWGWEPLGQRRRHHTLLQGTALCPPDSCVSPPGLLEISPVERGVVSIFGVRSGLFVAMNSKGKLYGSLRYSTEDCSFEEEIRPDGYNVYKSKKYGISVSLSSAKQRQQFKGKDFLPLSHFLPMINTVPVESTDFGEYGDYSQAFEPEVYSSPLETDSMDPFGITSKLSPVKSPSFQK